MVGNSLPVAVVSQKVFPSPYTTGNYLAFPPPLKCLFVCVEVLWSSQSVGVMSSTVILPNHPFTGQA